jgi:hypothetical protein
VAFSEGKMPLDGSGFGVQQLWNRYRLQFERGASNRLVYRSEIAAVSLWACNARPHPSTGHQETAYNIGG